MSRLVGKKRSGLDPEFQERVLDALRGFDGAVVGAGDIASALGVSGQKVAGYLRELERLGLCERGSYAGNLTYRSTDAPPRCPHCGQVMPASESDSGAGSG